MVIAWSYDFLAQLWASRDSKVEVIWTASSKMAVIWDWEWSVEEGEQLKVQGCTARKHLPRVMCTSAFCHSFSWLYLPKYVCL